jgi:hypothetical protein
LLLYHQHPEFEISTAWTFLQIQQVVPVSLFTLVQICYFRGSMMKRLEHLKEFGF